MAFAPFKVHPADKLPPAGAWLHTFDIRFARSQGLAGLFEAPANRLGWRGAGSLTIDTTGIRIAMTRGVRALWSRGSHRFSADSLVEAYREGNSLRLVFRSNDRNEVLPVWTRGKDQAAELVKLLPTLRTVEMDQTTRVHRYRPDWRRIWLLVLASMVAGVASLALLRPATDPPRQSSEPGDSTIAARDVVGNTHRTNPTEDARSAGRPVAGAASGKSASPPEPGKINSSRQPAATENRSASSTDAVERRDPASLAADQSAASPVPDSQAVPGYARYADAVRWMLEDFETQSGKGIDD